MGGRGETLRSCLKTLMQSRASCRRHESMAAEFFAVRVEREELSRRRKAWRAARPILTALVVPYIFGWGDAESRLNCEVQVYRLSDSHVVARYIYTRETEALSHLHSLESRIAEMPLPDLCAQLGIPAHRIK